MSRIFFSLALLAVLLLLSNLGLALLRGDFGASSTAFQEAKSQYESMRVDPDATAAAIEAAREVVTDEGRAMVRQRESFWAHIWLGIVAVLVSLLVNSISVTYFIGTSRWCREVVDAYGLDPELAEQSRLLKRRSFPFALSGILVTLLIAGLGAAADPYASTSSPATWVTAHWIVAMAGTIVIAVAFLGQGAAVSANYAVIDQILERVESIRAERRGGQELVLRDS